MGSRILSYAIVVIVAVGAAVGAVAALYEGAVPPADVVFVSLLFVLLGLGLRAGVIGWRSAHTAHAAARSIESRDPAEVARVAVDEERARMSADIEAVVRRALVGIRTHAQELAESAGSTLPTADVPAVLRAIQLEARRATAELRRLLEMLRAPEGDGAARAAGIAEPISGDGSTSVRHRIHRTDIGLAAVVTAVAIVEITTYLVDVRGPSSPGTVVLSAGVAVAVIVWRSNPGAATAVQALLVATGLALGSPVVLALWAIPALGLPLWAAIAQPVTRGLIGATVAVAGPIAIVVVALTSQWLTSPDNVFIMAVVFAAAAVTGFISRMLDLRRRRSVARGAARETELSRGAEEAVRLDRVATARELHDAVSGTIGVIAMQAGAAELLWTSDRRAAQRAIAVIVAAGDQALHELDDLVPRLAGAAWDGSAMRGPSDLPALVERMRRAGVDVHLAVDAVPSLPDDIAATTYRLAQEGVANAARHAVGARIDVVVSRRGDTIEVSVTDSGGAVSEPHPGGGYGLRGLAERVGEAGGEFRAGPRAEAPGFRLWAALPLTHAYEAPAHEASA